MDNTAETERIKTGSQKERESLEKIEKLAESYLLGYPELAPKQNLLDKLKKRNKRVFAGFLPPTDMVYILYQAAMGHGLFVGYDRQLETMRFKFDEEDPGRITNLTCFRPEYDELARTIAKNFELTQIEINYKTEDINMKPFLDKKLR